MTVTTPVREALAHAHRCEVEQRWAQASASYQEVLDNAQHLSRDERTLITSLRDTAIMRSHEMVSNVATAATEEAKAAFDRQDRRLAAKRDEALGRKPTGRDVRIPLDD